MSSMGMDISVADLATAIGIKPALGAALVSAPATKLPQTLPWLVLSPDTLAGAGLVAGQYVQVAVTNKCVPGPSTPIKGGASPIAFHPTQVPDVNAPGTHIRSLWAVCNASAGIAAALEATSANQGADGAATDIVGRYLAVARVWPAAKMPRSAAGPSPALLDAMGRPAHGTLLCVLPLPRPPLAPGQPAVLPILPCSLLVLRVCMDIAKCRPATLPEQATGSLGSSASLQGAGGVPVTPGRAGTPVQAGRAGMSTPASAARGGGGGGGGGISGAAPNTSASLGSWVLQNLGRSTSTSSRTDSAGGGQDVGGLTPQQREMLNRVAVQGAAGRAVRPGNPLPLPLLGHTLLCMVECASSEAPTAANTPLLVQPGTTKVHLLLQDEENPFTITNTTASSSDANAAESAVNGSQVGATSSSSNDPRARRTTAQLVAAAREAAEEAVDGSSAEAAVAAAERAVLAGQAASAGTSQGFAGLGGVSSYAAALRELVTLPLRGGALFKAAGVRPPRGVLLHGPPGSGKTVLARAAAADAGATLLLLNGPDVMSEFYGESEAGLKGVFAAARALAPAVLFIDEIDALAPSRGGEGGGDGGGGLAGALAGSGGGGSGGAASRVVTALLTLMDGAGGAGPGDGVVVIGATNRPSALDGALRRPGRLERELEVGAPGVAAREEILHARLARVSHTLTPAQVAFLAAAAHGCVGADLTSLVNEAALNALRRMVATPEGFGGDASVMCVTWEDMAAAQAQLRPSALREVAVEVPQVKWSDVGGLEDVKTSLQEAVQWPFANPGAFERLGARPPRGVLLYGPPGCSKTLLARAVAAEAGLNFLSVKGAELVSKYVGESEKAVAGLFARARATAPALVFFDELDGLARARDSAGAGGGMSDRVMAQLLTEMDGLQQHVGVVVLGATNRPDCIDAALLRPGRFDRLVLVPPPDQRTRGEIFKVKLKATPLAEDVDMDKLAAGSAGYTGADISAVVREAGLAALTEDLSATQVCWRHFEAALAVVRPSAPAQAALDRMYARFGAQGGQGSGKGGLKDGGGIEIGSSWPVFGATGPSSEGPLFTMGVVA